MMKPTYYITTPIYYVNARPHLGHAYTTIIADVLKKYHQVQGYDCYLLTGTDEHGDKIVQAAEKEGIKPGEYAERISRFFQEIWSQLDIANDDFIRTTEERHVKILRNILQMVYDRGDIYFGKYGGHYCFGCERFYTEKELVDGKCPDHLVEPTYIEEENYFFAMSRYQDWLIDHIKSHPDFIRPERYRNELLSFLSEPLEDLCISRPKSRLDWGVTLPFDDKFVTYVWFDALVNYISALGYPDGPLFQKYWPSAQHLIAKDILKPHGIFWPIMLKSAGIPLYRHLNVHGYWKINDSKMSKSIGNVVDALALKDVYGLDAFRYFILRDMVFGLDSSFSEEALVNRINSDLANDLGNLVQRSLAMVHKFNGGLAPEAARIRREGGELRAGGLRTIEEYRRSFDTLAFHKALIAVWEFINQVNRFIDHEAPWSLAKDPGSAEKLRGVLYEILEALGLTAGLLYPVMPATAAGIRQQLGLPDSLITLDLAEIEKALRPGHPVGQGSALFPRVEIGGAPARKKAGNGDSNEEAGKQKDRVVEQISFEDFKKVDLRIGLVKAAERVPKSNKLVKLTVDTGEERTVVAGIGQHFTPEDLIGRQVVIVVNLAPAKLMGVVSEGMLLAAGDETGLALITTSRPVSPGTRVS